MLEVRKDGGKRIGARAIRGDMKVCGTKRIGERRAERREDGASSIIPGLGHGMTDTDASDRAGPPRFEVVSVVSCPRLGMP